MHAVQSQILEVLGLFLGQATGAGTHAISLSKCVLRHCAVQKRLGRAWD